MVLFAPAGTSLTVPTAQPGRGQGASGHTLSLGPAPRSPSGICRRPALSSGPAPGGAARQDLEAPRCHWQWRRTAVAQRPPSRALPEPLSAGSNPGKLAAPQCVALLSYLEDRTGWDRFVLRASQIEPERSLVSTEANGRAFLACRLPTRLHCQLWRMHLPVSASCSRCWHVGCCRGLGAGELQLRLRVRSGLDLVQLHLRGGTCTIHLPSCFS